MPGKARDIDSIIDIITNTIDGVEVDQVLAIFPSDDNGVWYFNLSDKVIQIENSDGMCPFLIEAAGLAEERYAYTIEQAVKIIKDYLTAV